MQFVRKPCPNLGRGITMRRLAVDWKPGDRKIRFPSIRNSQVQIRSRVLVDQLMAHE
jgi:hypothetical protein